MNLSHVQTVEDAVASLDVMRLQEETGYRIDLDLYEANEVKDAVEAKEANPRPILENCHDDNAPLLHAPADAQCRVKMTEWCFEVVEFCKFEQETVTIAMSYLDRYLMNRHWGVLARQNRKVFQLAAMTCLYMAVKIHEAVKMNADMISALSGGAFDASHVEKMERSILMALQWRMHPPTPQAFLHHFMTLVDNSTNKVPSFDAAGILKMTEFQAKLATNDPNMVGFKPSSIAFASMANATDSSVDFLCWIAQEGRIDLVEASIAQERLCGLMMKIGHKSPSNVVLVSRLSQNCSYGHPIQAQEAIAAASDNKPGSQKAYKDCFKPTAVASPHRSPRGVAMTTETSGSR